jgi:hypothetical protein
MGTFMASVHAPQWIQVKATSAPEAVATALQIEPIENPHSSSGFWLLEFSNYLVLRAVGRRRISK